MAVSSLSRSPHWYGIPIRVAVVTFVGTLLSFSVTLLFSIFGTVIIAAIKGVHPDMRMAYRHFALPIGLVLGGVILVMAIAMEIRHYRQSKTLAKIERMS